MIKVKKSYTQKFDIETQRVMVSSEITTYSFLGVKLYSLNYDTNESHVKKDKTIGFKQ